MKKILWTIFIVITVLTMVITPITIHVFSPSMTSELSADGILDYMGNGIAAIPTIIIALVAIWQTNKANNIAEDANRDVFCGFFSSAYSHLVTIEIH